MADKEQGELGDIAKEARRLSAGEILTVVIESGRDELNRPLVALGLSALAGGVTIGLSGMVVALVRASGLSPAATTLLAAVLYPIGFIAVIIGRAQFFTENTLYPVVVYLDERRGLARLLWFWAVVLAANLCGAFLFALLMMRTGTLDGAMGAALGGAARTQLAHLGTEATAAAASAVFWSAIMGGWIMALVAWLVSASHWTTGQIMVVWALTFVIGLGAFAHCVTSSVEILAAVVTGQVTPFAYLQWLVPAVAGNLIGGVLIVSLLNYGQVKAGE